MIYEYRPEGVCSKLFRIDIEDNKVNNVVAIGGCSGNLQGINALMKGLTIDEVIQRLDGIKCGYKSTSCPDQIAQALKEYKDETSRENR